MNTTYSQLKRTCLALGAGLMLLATSIAAEAADSQTVKAEGLAAIRQGDKASARDKAIEDAMRKAVEQAIGAMVSSETVTENFQLISDKIYSKSKGYVRKHKILSQKVDGGVYHVTIEAVVSSGNLQNDLDGILAVLKAKNMPRVLLMISEQSVGSSATASWWQGEGSFGIDLGSTENALIDSWGKKGFEFVDRQALQGKLKVSKAMSGTQVNDDAVKEFALGTGAEVVVIGKAIATDVGTIMGTQMHSIRANISLRALALDTGSILATATATQAVGHIDPATGGSQALTKVTEKAGAKLLGKIMAKWEKSVSGPSKVALKIKGVAKSKYLRQLKTFIGNEVRGVQNVLQRSYRNKVAEFEVSIKGSGQSLAEELEEKDFGKFEVEINEITNNTVTATVNLKKK